MVLDRIFSGDDDEAGSDDPDAARAPDDALADADAAGIRRAFADLGTLTLEHRRFVAGYAYILVRLARSDGDINDLEIDRMEAAIAVGGRVSETQSVVLLTLARRMNSLYGATEDYAVTREFARRSTPHDRQRVMRAAFAVAVADGPLSQSELSELNEIGIELGFGQDEIAAIREQVAPTPFAGEGTIAEPERADGS